MPQRPTPADVPPMIKAGVVQATTGLTMACEPHETPAVPGVCDWFLRCDREAVRVVTHPILGYVRICERCAARMFDADTLDDRTVVLLRRPSEHGPSVIERLCADDDVEVV